MGGSRGGTGGLDPPENHKNIGFPSNIDLDPLKPQCYQASIQWWAIIGTPANVISMAFRLRATDDQL